MRIAIGSDHGGYQLKDEVKQLLVSLGHEVTDVGWDRSDSVDYPDYAVPVCQKIIADEVDKGILICGTGIGMSIAANKVPGIRCALVHDVFSAKATREHNDSNVLAMGARVIGSGLALEIVRTWVGTDFSQDVRHVDRIGKIKAIEDRFVLHP